MSNNPLNHNPPKSIPMPTLIIAMVLVGVLKPDPTNPRIHSKKQIRQVANSIRAFGFLIPILIDAQGNIIAGHARWLAAQLLGLTEVPTICVSHLTPAQIKLLVIADNQLTENADWSDQQLGINLKELSGLVLGCSLEVSGLSMGKIDLLIEGLSITQENVPDDDQLPAIFDTPPVTKLGDLWQLGKHRLLCGSAIEAASFALLMQNAKAVLIFIDPPYNVKISGNVGGNGKIQHREFAMASGEMTPEEFIAFLRAAISLLAEHSSDGSIHFICMDWRHVGELLAAANPIYHELKNMIVWAKDNGGMGTFYRSQHELIFAYKNGTAPHVNNFELGQHGRYRTNVWKYPGMNSFARKTDEGNLLELHSTVKPVALLNPEEVVYFLPNVGMQTVLEWIRDFTCLPSRRTENQKRRIDYYKFTEKILTHHVVHENCYGYIDQNTSTPTIRRLFVNASQITDDFIDDLERFLDSRKVGLEARMKLDSKINEISPKYIYSEEKLKAMGFEPIENIGDKHRHIGHIFKNQIRPLTRKIGPPQFTEPAAINPRQSRLEL